MIGTGAQKPARNEGHLREIAQLKVREVVNTTLKDWSEQKGVHKSKNNESCMKSGEPASGDDESNKRECQKECETSAENETCEHPRRRKHRTVQHTRSTSLRATIMATRNPRRIKYRIVREVGVAVVTIVTRHLDSSPLDPVGCQAPSCLPSFRKSPCPLYEIPLSYVRIPDANIHAAIHGAVYARSVSKEFLQSIVARGRGEGGIPAWRLLRR